MAQELTVLKKALHNERAERIRTQAAEMEKILKNLKPIHVPQPKDNRINELEKDLMKVKHVSGIEWNNLKDGLNSEIKTVFLFLQFRITSFH